MSQKEEAEGEQKNKEPVVGFVHSSELYELFRQGRFSLIISTYQAQRILVMTPGQEKLSMLMRLFERPTGIAYDGSRLALCSKRQIWFFEQTLGARSPTGDALPNDVVLTPRMSYVTGDVLAHEAAWINGKLVFINTRFSCLATVSEHHSFQPLWKPPFISKLSADDRCHLNGMAVDSRGVQFVTALATSDVEEGWRENKKESGVLVHVPSGQIVCQKLCMPHSPRIYAGRLWLLDSGRGELQVVDPQSGVREPVCRLPGYLRGLAFFDRYAFIGLSKIRESNIFGGLPISEAQSDLQCAVYVVDIETGRTVGFIKFTKGIEELFDITVIPNFTSPNVIGFDEETIDGLYTLPEGVG